ncbi:ferredoxin [Nocardia sp. NPDC004278]
MDIKVDLGLCQGYGVCAQIAPEVFELDDDGYAVVPDDTTVPEGMEARVRESAGACPVQAVILSGESADA